MIRDEILEYPYHGTITRIIPGEGREKDSQRIIYEGVMDEHMVEKEYAKLPDTIKKSNCVCRSDCHSCTGILPTLAGDCPRALPGKL